MSSDRSLVDSAFPDDDGTAAERTRELLAGADGSTEPTDYLRAVAQLCADRVLVPVVATATQLAPSTDPGQEPTGTTGQIPSDKEAEMAVVMLQSGDGRRAMVAFTGTDALEAWDASARPVPVTLDIAAQSALADNAIAILIDYAGPHPLVLDGEVLAQLAEGHRLVELPGDQFGWAVPQTEGAAGDAGE